MATRAEVLPLYHGSDRREDLSPEPIPSCNVIDGQPEATTLVLAERPGGLAAGLWSCTAGRFRWDYATDEVIHIVEGEAVITDQDGEVVLVGPGDVVRFVGGTSAVWDVPERIKKVWVLPAGRRDPASRLLRRVRRSATARLGRRRRARLGLPGLSP
jgi:hypothetical protein